MRMDLAHVNLGPWQFSLPHISLPTGFFAEKTQTAPANAPVFKPYDAARAATIRNILPKFIHAPTQLMARSILDLPVIPKREIADALAIGAIADHVPLVALPVAIAVAKYFKRNVLLATVPTFMHNAATAAVYYPLQWAIGHAFFPEQDGIALCVGTAMLAGVTAAGFWATSHFFYDHLHDPVSHLLQDVAADELVPPEQSRG